MSFRIVVCDVMAGLAGLADESVQCAVTSPPYWGLRDYGIAGQIGLEPTPGEYVDRLVAVFREVRRVLRSDGVLWLNLGDSYITKQQGSQGHLTSGLTAPSGACAVARSQAARRRRVKIDGLKNKDLAGIPWRVAFALQADGWWLRSDVIWSKPNPTPESVTDRPTRSHEYLFLLTKRSRYFYDAEAISEPATCAGRTIDYTGAQKNNAADRRMMPTLPRGRIIEVKATRNRRSVWTIATSPFPDAHFATFPPALVEPCILAGSRPGDTVLDPFAGAGTALLVADRLGRHGVGIELNPEYARLATARVSDEAPLLHQEHISEG